MLHLIGKNLWARRYRNGWLLAELIIVSMVIWVLTDPIVVTTHDRGLPTGITEEGMYRLNLAAVSSKSARFEAGKTLRRHVLPMYDGFFRAFATMKMCGMQLCSLETSVRFVPVHGAVR